MSAPPIGMMSSTPSTSDTATISQKIRKLSVVTRRMMSTTRAMPSAAFTTWRIGSMIGLPDMRPSSFRNAMTDPVKVTAPMATPRLISMRAWPWMSATVPMPKLSGAYIAAAATITAARPTSEWNAATSCGIEVIGMRRAVTAPTLPPIARPSTISQKPPKLGVASASVVRMAMPMPIMPNMLPCRLVVGCDRPRSARMNRMPETR